MFVSENTLGSRTTIDVGGVAVDQRPIPLVSSSSCDDLIHRSNSVGWAAMDVISKASTKKAWVDVGQETMKRKRKRPLMRELPSIAVAAKMPVDQRNIAAIAWAIETRAS